MVAWGCFTAIASCYWVVQWLILARVLREVPRLEDLPPAGAAAGPRVSAILTARNEAASLEEAVRARLEEEYANLELVIVDDRSTDETPQRADRLAAANPRVKVVHLTELPAGWLGKLNALAQGVAHSAGEWLLFSDADVAVRSGVLGPLLAYCERRRLDHCVVLPRLLPVNPLLDCLTSVFARIIALNLRQWAIEDPASSASVGIGAFNLVRRSALERSPGLAWLKMEVADDLTLGQMLKATGARQSVVNGAARVDLTFHPTLRDALVSAERATFTAIGNFSLVRLVALALASLALEGSALISLALAPNLLAAAGSCLVALLALATQLRSNRWQLRGSWNLVLLPFAELLMAYSQLRSGVLGTLRGGIQWRGTFYSNAELKAGRRFGTSWGTLRGQETTSRSG